MTMTAAKKNARPRIQTIPASGPSGGKIRAEVIRAMEKQHKAQQGVLDALNELEEDVVRGVKLGVLRVGE